MSGQSFNQKYQQIENCDVKYYYDNDSDNVEYEDNETCNELIMLDAYYGGREFNELPINTNNNLEIDFNNHSNNMLSLSNNHSAVVVNNNTSNNNTNNINIITNQISINNIVSNNLISTNVSNNPINTQRNITNILDTSGLDHYSSELEGNEEYSESNNNNRNFETQLDDIFDQLTYAISTEKQNIKNQKTNLANEKMKLNDFKTSEKSKFDKEKDIWKENNRIIESFKAKETDILDLDIGGTQNITTTRSTLLKYPNSALSAMFSGRHKNQKHNNRYFIDRDGNVFIHLVNFLRSGKFPVFNTKTEEVSFFEELEFWQINYKENQEPNHQFDSEWYASTLTLESSNRVIRKQSMQHGIVFCKLPINVHNSYIEFKIVMNIPSRGKNHLFIGVVDKSKYKYEHLVSTFWKDSPSSFYWDVWNTKLIKTDENGIQIGSIGSYGCQCEENETKIGIYYDFKNKTLSFFKNGVNQGVAFNNVPSGLTPSLDLWFESGTIEILKKNSPEERIFL